MLERVVSARHVVALESERKKYVLQLAVGDRGFSHRQALPVVGYCISSLRRLANSSHFRLTVWAFGINTRTDVAFGPGPRPASPAKSSCPNSQYARPRFAS